MQLCGKCEDGNSETLGDELCFVVSVGDGLLRSGRMLNIPLSSPVSVVMNSSELWRAGGDLSCPASFSSVIISTFIFLCLLSCLLTHFLSCLRCDLLCFRCHLLISSRAIPLEREPISIPLLWYDSIWSALLLKLGFSYSLDR